MQSAEQVVVITIAPVKQCNGLWRADNTEHEAPLCTIEFHNEMALLPDDKKRALVMALVRRYCQDDI